MNDDQHLVKKRPPSRADASAAMEVIDCDEVEHNPQDVTRQLRKTPGCIQTGDAVEERNDGEVISEQAKTMLYTDVNSLTKGTS